MVIKKLVIAMVGLSVLSATGQGQILDWTAVELIRKLEAFELAEAIKLEQAIRKITFETAAIWGIEERGLLQKNYVADITIFDKETIDRGPEYFTQDVPGDGHRYVRDAIGIDTVIIGGEISYQKASGYTDAQCGVILPGKVA